MAVSCARCYSASANKFVKDPYEVVTPGQIVKVKVIEVDVKRNPLLPDVPTFAEAGIAGMEAGLWYGIVAPSGKRLQAQDKQDAIRGRLKGILGR